MMKALTHLGSAPGTILPGLVLVVLGGAGRRVGLAMLAANLLSHVPVQVLKRLVARPRPADAYGVPLALVDLPDPFSFPSGHAAASTAVAVTASWAYPWMTPFAFLFATVIAISRVKLRVHYFSDVIAGMMLGLGGAIGAHILLW